MLRKFFINFRKSYFNLQFQQIFRVAFEMHNMSTSEHPYSIIPHVYALKQELEIKVFKTK